MLNLIIKKEELRIWFFFFYTFLVLHLLFPHNIMDFEKEGRIEDGGKTGILVPIPAGFPHVQKWD